MLRALLDAYPAAAEEKHPQVEVFGFFLFMFFWGVVSFREFHTLKTLNQIGFLRELSSDFFTLVV